MEKEGFEELVYRVIGCCVAVHEELGPVSWRASIIEPSNSS